MDKQARLNHQRVFDLMATKVASQDDLDKAVETLQVAAADVKRSQAAIAEAESQVLTAEKNLAYQQERLTYTQIWTVPNRKLVAVYPRIILPTYETKPRWDVLMAIDASGSVPEPFIATAMAFARQPTTQHRKNLRCALGAVRSGSWIDTAGLGATMRVEHAGRSSRANPGRPTAAPAR